MPLPKVAAVGVVLRLLVKFWVTVGARYFVYALKVFFERHSQFVVRHVAGVGFGDNHREPTDYR